MEVQVKEEEEEEEELQVGEEEEEEDHTSKETEAVKKYSLIFGDTQHEYWTDFFGYEVGRLAKPFSSSSLLLPLLSFSLLLTISGIVEKRGMAGFLVCPN